MSFSMLMVGCGRMSSAMLSRWNSMPQAPYRELAIIKPTVKEGFTCYSSLADLPAANSPDVILFAVKPDKLSSVMPEYKERFAQRPLYVTVAAGKDLAFYAQHLGAQARIIRIMPNTPSEIGEGMNVVATNDHCTTNDGKRIKGLLAPLGEQHWLEHESQMDAATAVAGSGPAYQYLFMQAMIEAGIKQGLPRDVAAKLATQTCKGAAIFAAEKAIDLMGMIGQVASKGGTTQAALDSLNADPSLGSKLEDAIAAATQRSKTLSQ